MLYGRIRWREPTEIVFAHQYTLAEYAVKQVASVPVLELGYLCSGAAYAEANGCEFRIPEGSFFLLSHLYPFRLHTEEGTVHMHYTVALSGAYDFTVKEGPFPHEKQESGIPLPLCLPPGEESRALFRLLQDLIRLYNGHGFCAQEEANAMAHQLLARLSRAASRDAETAPPSATEEALHYKVKTYLRQNAARAVSLREVAEAFGKTPNYLNRVFRRVEGTTIRQYANREKMLLVAALVSEGRSFREAGEAVGISDVNYLSRLFSRQMGVSYSEYRRDSVENTIALVDEVTLRKTGRPPKDF